MDGVAERVRSTLEGAFPGAKIDLEQASPSDKIGGTLIWDGFENMEQIDRQRQLAKVIREGLSREDQLRVTAILTFTNAEVTIPSDD